MNIEKKIKFITDNCNGNVIFTFNSHKGYYFEIQEYILDIENNQGDKVFQKKECIEKNQIWEIQFYPNTPVSFYTVFACDLEFALDKSIEILKKEVL